VPSSLRVLPEVVKAVNGQIEVLMDGGIRRGTDIVKALCLGARAVLLGRLYIWGLAAGGEQGVRETLLNFLADLDLTLALSGYCCCAELNEAALARAVGATISE